MRCKSLAAVAGFASSLAPAPALAALLPVTAQVQYLIANFPAVTLVGEREHAGRELRAR